MPNKIDQNIDNTMNSIKFYNDQISFDDEEEEIRNIIIYSKKIKGKQCTYLPWVPIEIDESIEDNDEEISKLMKSKLDEIRKGFSLKENKEVKENKENKDNKEKINKITFFDKGWYIVFQGSHADKLKDYLETIGYENIEIKN